MTQDYVSGFAGYSAGVVSQVERGLPFGNIAERRRRVRRALLWIARDRLRKARRARRLRTEQQRITRSWANLPEADRDALVAALSERVWRLLDDGKLEEADALGFSLPKGVHESLMDEFFMEEEEIE